MILARRRPAIFHRLPFTLVAALFMAGTAHADPDDFVFEPYAEPGSVAVQYAGGIERERDGSSEAAHSVALAWGVSERWFTAVYAGWYREAGESLGFDAVSWVNHLVLTSPGSPVDVGAYLEIERPKDRSEGYGLTWGPTLRFDGPADTQVNANLWLTKNIRAESAAPADLIYQWQIKRLWRPHLEWGAQGFGNFGTWNHWAPASAQEHSVGPALFARWALGSGQVLRADAAALLGVGSGSPRFTLRLRTQLQF